MKTWLITGCSTGFGRVLTEELVKTGNANVVATARNVATLATLQSERVLALPLDVTDRASIDSAVSKAKAHFGSIDVLVNNAGYGMLGALEESSIEDTRRMFDTNVFGLIEMTQAVLPVMRAQKSGWIVNMSSAAGLVPTPGFSMYNSSKFAVEGLSEAMALEVAHLGIKVTIVEPGPFRTDFAGRSLDAQTPMEAYDASVGKTRQYIDTINGTQPGDPVRASQLLIRYAEDANPPLRLPMGVSAMDRIQARIKTFNEQMQEIDAVARSADYPKNAA